MIRVNVMYPNSEGARFDMDYYCNTHVPMVGGLLGEAIKGAAVESGLAGAAEGAPASFIAMGHLTFESVESFQQAFGPHADQILGDIPNFTNVEPQIQVSEVRI